MVWWHGFQSNAEKSRQANESAARHAMPRSESSRLQTDDEVNGSHGAVRDRPAGDEAREQIADWLSMYEAAVRSSSARRGERQGQIGCSLWAGEM